MEQYLQIIEGLLKNTYFMVFLTVWTLFWKGLALWNAARNNQRNWFVALLVLSTVGILDIIYLKFFKEKRKRVSEKQSPN